MALINKLIAIADAIRAKTGGTDVMTLDEMVIAIEGIETGGDTSAEDRLLEGPLVSFTNDRVTSVRDMLFNGLEELVEVSFPKVTSIGYSVFGYSFGLKSISFPKVEQVDSNAFTLTAITEVNFPEALYLGSGAFQSCNSLKTVYLPKATYVGSNCFYSCDVLSDIYIPELTILDNNAFAACTSLVSVVFPEVLSVETETFAYCTSLTTVDLPKVTSIAFGAFAYSTALTTLLLRNSVVCTLSNATYTFKDTPIANGTGYVYVPDALVDSYKSATNWSTYASQIKPLSEYTEA